MMSLFTNVDTSFEMTKNLRADIKAAVYEFNDFKFTFDDIQTYEEVPNIYVEALRSDVCCGFHHFGKSFPNFDSSVTYAVRTLSDRLKFLARYPYALESVRKFLFECDFELKRLGLVGCNVRPCITSITLSIRP